jgi:hypothetical protein
MDRAQLPFSDIGCRRLPRCEVPHFRVASETARETCEAFGKRFAPAVSRHVEVGVVREIAEDALHVGHRCEGVTR